MHELPLVHSTLFGQLSLYLFVFCCEVRHVARLQPYPSVYFCKASSTYQDERKVLLPMHGPSAQKVRFLHTVISDFFRSQYFQCHVYKVELRSILGKNFLIKRFVAINHSFQREIFLNMLSTVFPRDGINLF